MNKSYSLADWKNDLRVVLKRAGADGTHVVFLLTDLQIIGTSSYSICLCIFYFLTIYLSMISYLSIYIYLSFINLCFYLSIDIHIPSIINLSFHLTYHLSICMCPDETFLEDISMILTTGEVPNLFTHDEKANILERVQVGYRFLYEPKFSRNFVNCQGALLLISVLNYLFLFLWYALVFTGVPEKLCTFTIY